MATTYDAFLSYNSKNCDAAAAIARYLKEKAGLKIFFDQWEIIPGSPVQETLEKALADSAACVIFIGPSGSGKSSVVQAGLIPLLRTDSLIVLLTPPAKSDIPPLRS